MKVNLNDVKNAGVNSGEVVLGAMLGHVIISKSPDTIKKFVPVGIIALSLGAMVLMPQNKHANSIASGSLVMGVIGAKTQIASTPQVVAADGTVKGLTIKGKAKTIADMLLPNMSLRGADLGSIEEMDFSNLMGEAQDPVLMGGYEPEMQYLGEPENIEYVG